MPVALYTGQAHGGADDGTETRPLNGSNGFSPLLYLH